MELSARVPVLRVPQGATRVGPRCRGGVRKSRSGHGDHPPVVLSQGLVRPREGRVLGGVIAGLGRRFGIDPWPARLLFVLILMIIPGSQILIYPVLWILMPTERLQPAVAPLPAAPTPPAPTAPAA